MRQISIMHVVLEPRYSGAETLVRDLARAHMESGHRLSIATLRPSQQSFAAEIQALQSLGCRMFIPDRNLEGWRRAKWLYQAVRKARPDVVFAHTALPSLYTRLALRLTRRPVVVSVLHAEDDFKNPRLRRIERLVMQRHASLVGVSSRILENYRRRITDRVVMQVIRNGVNTERFAKPAKESRQWREKLYAPAPGEVILLQVGRVYPPKHQHVSIEALARLKESGVANLRLVFAGPVDDEQYRNRLMALAAESNVERQIQWLGPRSDIPELLAGADIYLMPSGWEAHSVAALEALASGACCVFSGIDGFADLRNFPGVTMIGDPPTGADLASCLRELLAEGRWQRRFERDLGSLTIERCAADYLRLAGQLLRIPDQAADRAEEELPGQTSA